MIKLDVGCGPNKRSGYLGVDICKLKGVDYIVDLEKERLPFEDKSVDEIYCSHFLEHMTEVSKILEEFNRVLKHNGKIIIKVPHYTNPYSYHFTHKSYWSSYSFEQQYLDYYMKTSLVLVSKRVKFCFFKFIDPIIEKLANLNLSIYERIFSSYFKAWELEFVLKKDEKRTKKLLIS